MRAACFRAAPLEKTVEALVVAHGEELSHSARQ
jgi:hypothetical protein